jgi:Raf kinase inhibitor-like YbhB/YbcL family protein
MNMTLHSDAFAHREAIPPRFVGDGDDLSPPLAWSEVPVGTRELALIVEDPDANRAEPWVHWVLYEIPSDLQGLTGAIPTFPAPGMLRGALQGKNSWGGYGYRGPAPPEGRGVHHYHFHLFALGTPLHQVQGLDRAHLLKAMEGHVLAEAEMVGTYER